MMVGQMKAKDTYMNMKAGELDACILKEGRI